MNLTSWPVRSASDFVELKSFLQENALPSDDIHLDGNQFVLYRNGSGRIIGSGGLEFYGDYCLLRSVAVAREFRKQGYGEKIAEDLINRARERSVSGVYLLTETAENFFTKYGFKKQSRQDAPKEIQSSSEFSSVCPVSAALMSIDIVERSK